MSGTDALTILYAPTASGKSALAIEWAQNHNGTIVNADALQVYDALHILSACPDAADRTRAPHALYGFADPRKPMSAANWAQIASTYLAENTGPFLVTGGTGLYISTLLDGIAPVPDVDPAIRAQCEADFERLGPQEFHNELAKLDPVLAAKIHPNHRQRLIRAMEVARGTDAPLSAWHERPHMRFLPDGMAATLIVLLPDKAWIVERATRRFDMMIAVGVLDEVKAFGESGGIQMAAAQSLGFHALWAHIQGRLSLDEAKDVVLRDTASFIKRQLTWGRQQFAKRDGAIVVETLEEAQSALA